MATMTKTIRPDDLAVLRFLDTEADALRRALGLNHRGEVVTWYERPDSEQEYAVVADGYGRFELLAYEGRNPNIRAEHHRATYSDEDAASRAALRLDEFGVAWDARDEAITEEDNESEAI
jgi:hypothetical protein